MLGDCGQIVNLEGEVAFSPVFSVFIEVCGIALHATVSRMHERQSKWIESADDLKHENVFVSKKQSFPK